LTAYSFLKEVLGMCEVEEIILDKGPWYRDVLNRLGIKFRHESFGERSLVESVFSSFKQRAQGSSSVPLRLTSEGGRRGLQGGEGLWNAGIGFARCSCFTSMSLGGVIGAVKLTPPVVIESHKTLYPAQQNQKSY